ncbi:MAG: hypothetical protein U9R20_08145 [Thermodesulfobacteriota bacterium]|nr:hypothetical protein [Thermodesulfobacteriota bacterium]
MDKKKMLFDEIESESYNSFDKPFNFVEEGGRTVLICETDPVVRAKISNILEEMGYYITESATAHDSLRDMRFHAYHLIVVNESFDAQGAADNHVLDYIRHLPMNVRRNIFVTMLSVGVRTRDNMAAFAESVNLIINLENIDDAGAIIERGIANNEVFYGTFKDALKRAGHV